MTPTALPQVRTALTQWSSQELAEVAEKVLHVKTIAEVEHILTKLQNPHKKG
jgi:phosphoenolpyruvate-protein kinase (PTS system EI component)